MRRWYHDARRRQEDSPETLTVFACQLSPARLTSSRWSTGFYCQVLYAKVEPIKRRFDATAAHARGGSGGSDARAMPGRSDRSRRSFRLVPGALAPAVPLFSAVRGGIPVLPCATRAHPGADTGRKAVSRGLTRQPRDLRRTRASQTRRKQMQPKFDTRLRRHKSHRQWTRRKSNSPISNFLSVQTENECDQSLPRQEDRL